MTAAEKLKCLEGELESLVARYARDCLRHKRSALTLKITSVCLAAVITTLLGVKIENADLRSWFSNLALILGGLITVLSAYEAFFDPRSLWIRETVTFARLKDLQRDLRFWAAGLEADDIQVDSLQSFKTRMDHILEDSLKYWMKIKGAPDIERIAQAALPQARQELSDQAHRGPT